MIYIVESSGDEASWQYENESEVLEEALDLGLYYPMEYSRAVRVIDEDGILMAKCPLGELEYS